MIEEQREYRLQVKDQIVEGDNANQKLKAQWKTSVIEELILPLCAAQHSRNLLPHNNPLPTGYSNSANLPATQPLPSRPPGLERLRRTLAQGLCPAILSLGFVHSVASRLKQDQGPLH